jgi:hypothetical protein
MPQRASVFCNFYIRVDREALVSERALDVGSVAFKALSTKISLQIYNLQKRPTESSEPSFKKNEVKGGINETNQVVV